MGEDEYHPLSKTSSNLVVAGGIGYTVIDSIDTMLIMGLEDEYRRARDWVANDLTFERDGNFNTFEVRRIYYLTFIPQTHRLNLPDHNTCSGWPFVSLPFV